MTSGSDSRLVIQREIAEIFGVSREAIRRWTDQGMPTHRDAKGAVRYLPAEVIRWREERAERLAIEGLAVTDLDEARRRKLAAEAALAEIELAKQRDQVVELELIGAQVGAAFATVRARLLGIGAAILPRLQLATDAVDMKRIIDDAVRQALEGLSNGSLEFAGDSDRTDTGDDPAPGGRNAGPAAGTNPKRMGRRKSVPKL